MSQSNEEISGVLSYSHARLLRLGEAHADTVKKLNGRTSWDMTFDEALKVTESDLPKLVRDREQISTDIWGIQSAGRDHLRLNEVAIVDMAHMAAGAAGVKIVLVEQPESIATPIEVHHA